MITDKKIALKPILESFNGIHLTAYLENRGDLVDLKSQLQETIDEAFELLYSTQTIEERNRFFEPLYSLLRDARIFKNIKGNIGLFRTKDSFRILNLPVEVERQCHVASSFHIKPLLRWMQLDREFLVLGLKKDSAHLYFGNQTLFQIIDTLVFPKNWKTDKSLENYKNMKNRQEEVFLWLREWFEQVTHNSNPRLFLAGDKELAERFRRNLKYQNIEPGLISDSFDDHNLSEICSNIRKRFKAEAKKMLQQTFLEFDLAEEENRGKKNIFQISRAVASGNVQKLIIADDINIFGKIDKKTGNLSIHPHDLDHEDDDILDDLAQAVLASGGEVVISPREEIPQGRLILAILHHEERALENVSDPSETDLHETPRITYF